MQGLQKIITILGFIIISIQANELTQEQLQKLQTPIVKDLGETYMIKEYNRINFDRKILFGGKELQNVIVETYAAMPKGLIHKEHFIAISSTLSDQIMQSVFMTPQYFEHLQSVEYLSNIPLKKDLIIKINFEKNGYFIKG